MAIEFDADCLHETAERLGLRLVVLFGSRAQRKEHSDSDLDLAVLRSSSCKAGFLDLHEEVSEIFHEYSVDLVILNTADHLLRYEVMRAGELLYGDTLEFLEYKSFAFRDYVDSIGLRELEHALFHKKLAFIERELSASA